MSCIDVVDSGENSSRQVWSIVYSCVAATVSCTWVSVHVNVPFYREGEWTHRGRQLWIMLVSIIAPDVILMWAFMQWRGARAIRNDVNMLIDQFNESREKNRKIHHWTITHGHFLQMGGFQLSSSAEEYSWFIRTPYQIKAEDNWEGVLLDNDFVGLVRAGLLAIPTITEKEINDKSKGDAFTKLLVLLQSSWFIAQLIARRCQNMAITELELTTLALVALNSVMYICWWHKPLSVQSPIVINPIRKCACIQVAGTHEEIPYTQLPTHPSHSSMASKLLRFGFSIISLRAYIANLGGRAWRRLKEKKLWIIWDMFAPLWIVSLIPITAVALLVFAPLEALFDPWPNPPSAISDASISKEFTTYKLLLKIHAIPDINKIRLFFLNVYRVNSTMLYCRRPDSPALLLTGFLGLVGICFGSIHMLAWNSFFPSPFARLLWRSSSLMVIGSSFTIFVAAFIDKFDSFTYSPRLASVSNVLMKSGALIVPLVYVFSRLSLIAQALVQLRNLPCSAFDTVNWTNFIPHI